jgi:HNH endonuclease
MGRCIFCKNDGTKFTTREHILPESLGGGDWAVLPSGLFCDECQNRFGSEIEQQALGDYPFSFLRVFLSIPAKKLKPPWFTSCEGTIRASLQPGTIGYDPAPPFEQAINEGRKTEMRLIAEPMKPHMVCRFLLKMGIEVLAADNPSDAFQAKFDSARNYALTGDKAGGWWYLQNERMHEASRFLTKGISEREWTQGVRLEVVRLEEDQEMFHLKLLYLDIFTPLTSGIQPEMEGLEEPEFRLFRV